jgi:NADH-quinone oxidoreductase subunit L
MVTVLDPYFLLMALGVIVVLSPFLLTLALGISSLLDRSLAEETTTRLVYAAVVGGLLASVAMLVTMLVSGTRYIPITLGDWVVVPRHYHFSIKFIFDRLSIPFAILTFVLSGTIAAFASKYMHRERGFNRFFMLYALFMLGMIVASLAGTIETLFAGWELVGLSSALLVAFFQERPAPARNGLWVWTVYRVSDAALLLAAVAMHHLSGQGDFEKFLGAGSWPDEHAAITSLQALGVGSLLLIAAAGKSALVPFSGWLPRAMEGPTPSSAVFYGALSVHLGAFLLLRVSPLFERSTAFAVLVVVIGLTTALYAYLIGSVQTDIKSALSFASLSQVGIIVAEIGFGLRYIPLVHILGHACLRTLQFVRAPTLLQDYHLLENAIGDHLPRAGAGWNRGKPPRARAWIYRLALERGYFDVLLRDQVVGRFVTVFRKFDSWERRWTDFLSGGASREAESVKAPFGTIEEFS